MIHIFYQFMKWKLWRILIFFFFLDYSFVKSLGRFDVDMPIVCSLFFFFFNLIFINRIFSHISFNFFLVHFWVLFLVIVVEFVFMIFSLFLYTNRWNTATKAAQSASGNNKQDALAKAHALQSEYEDNTLLFHQLQDSLATEMYTFVAGERGYAESVMKVRHIFLLLLFLNFVIASLQVI